ncbi:bifunctional diaminohydroxyphosphoribosylaminopyrimidine deaminase/5-amino-6-(5-phosphoribosylamino)uracil reductase RibD [Alteromonadaceae bacterium BrNp21-10]|nr:bifunctional diaminohydroxyphosphoribosylaminopyrimidine deaminase/5-amino-6-(5-phosphoribosylamino)uracil reductase RibD [Alteromonadaceae bacterium BrNp21-10]
MSEFSAFDHEMMALAMQLAARGRYGVSPNPMVGCVITNLQRQIIGQGWHKKAGTGHAEVHALAEAGDNARGATVYVSLEPCSHFGRTPPCAEALIKAGVSRVVAAMQDPNPQVGGSGLAMLAAQGIQTQSGLLQTQAEQLNRGFIQRMRTGRPFVTVKLAASLDGKTALQNGQSQWITGPDAREDVQRHRAASCAILSGSGTVLADNPSLNVRPSPVLLADMGQQPIRQPTRVIIDGRNQLTPDLQLINLPGDVLIVNCQPSEFEFSTNTRQWQAPLDANNKLDLTAVMAYLGTQQLNNIWVEAGAKLAGALIQQQLVDELIVYLAPKLMGNHSQNLLNLPLFERMQDVVELQWQDCRMVGADLKLTLKLTPSPITR